MANKTMSKEVNVVCNVDFFIGQPLFLFQGGLIHTLYNVIYCL
jgi:hypothetical protein